MSVFPAFINERMLVVDGELEGSDDDGQTEQGILGKPSLVSRHGPDPLPVNLQLHQHGTV